MILTIQAFRLDVSKENPDTFEIAKGVSTHAEILIEDIEGMFLQISLRINGHDQEDKIRNFFTEFKK